MRVVLFHPRGYVFNSEQTSINSLGVMPPIGLASIAAVLRKADHEVIIFDAALHVNITNQEWAKRICAIKPDMVGFTATTLCL